MDVARLFGGRPLLVLAVLALGLLAGCARTTVSHLESRPVVAATPTTLPMKYFRFEFTGKPAGDGYRIQGRAVPVSDDLPPWVDRLEELTLAAYLRSPAGEVIAESEKPYKGMALGQGAAVPFEFDLSPAGDAAGNYAVSFGYKAIFGSQKARNAVAPKGPPPAGAVFFAGEGAVRMQ
ncbi:hypothetical protein [Desulfovibrio sp. TomC]|uniref:hypothetical protein n=1 Tax=Desulfovibrio sp. TomC TaxID=1562888 RepID=UPI0005B8E56E|nr:hypothetical protein [Desulfovibrio sp. TomC]